MGNSQSVPEKRDGRRLSKQARSKSIPTNPYNQGPEPPLTKQSLLTGPQTEVEDTTLPQRPGIDQLQQRSSEGGHPMASFVSLPPTQENEDEVAKLRSSNKEPLSKMMSPCSSSTNLASTSRPTMVIDPKMIDLSTAVGILEELRKTASPEDLVALRKLTLFRFCWTESD